MFEKNLKSISRKALPTVFAIMILCCSTFAQKSQKTNSADFYFKRGLAKMKIAASPATLPTVAEKKYAEAAAYFDEAIELDPDIAVFYLERGKCHYKTRSIESAVRDFSKAIELEPDLAEAYIERGKVIADLHLSDEDREETVRRAFDDFDKAIEINSANADFYYTRGKLYMFRENFEDALKDSDKAVELNPRFAETFILRAEVYFNLRNYEKAIADGAKAINLGAKNIEGLTIRGRAYAASEKYELAIADYNAALKLEPDNPDLYFYRASAYSKIGKTREANIDKANEKFFLEPFLKKKYAKLPEFGKQAFEGLFTSVFEELP